MSKSHRTSRWLKKLLLRRAFVALLLLAQIVFIGLNIAFYSQLRWFSILWQVIGFFTALHLTTHSQHNATFKISMVFLILLFPVFGAVFYWFFHYQTTTIGYRKRLHKKEQETAHAFGFVPDMADTASIENPDAGRMIRYLRDVSGFPVCGNTETEYYDDGKAYQAALLKALRSDMPQLTDQLAEQTGLPIQRVLPAITLLEISGWAAQNGARSFVRTVALPEE